MKIYYYGKRVSNYQASIKGRIQGFIAKLLYVIKRGTITVSAVLFIYILGFFSAYSTVWVYAAPEGTQSPTEPVKKELTALEIKVEQLKKELIEKLQKCESKGYTENDALIVHDTNKVSSVGLFQFQRKTVIAYYKKLYSKTINMKEATLIALDYDKSLELASDIIFKDKGLSNWDNCARKNNLYEEVKFINKLK